MLTGNDIKALYELVKWRSSTSNDPRWSALCEKLEQMHHARNPGRLVFRIELPLEPVQLQHGNVTTDVRLAPTMNEYAGQPAWKRHLARKEVDRRIAELQPQFPQWECWVKKRRVPKPAHVTKKHKLVDARFVEQILDGTRRFVRVTRRSSGKHDEPSTDAIGGKIPIDRLKICGIIAGDSQKWLAREAVWEPVPRGEGSVIIEVFEG